MHSGDLWDRLKNDLTFRVGTIYAGGSWFIVEALDTLGMTAATVRSAALVLAVGFIIVVPVTWLIQRRGSVSRESTDTLSVDASPAASADQPGYPGTDDGAAVAGGAAAGGSLSAPTAGGRAVRRAGVRRWATAVVVLCGVAATMWVLGARASGHDVPDAATRMAVLPFHATGGNNVVDEYGVGMVNLLSAAFDGLGGIRTVPSQTVLARVGPDDGVTPMEEHLRIGESLGAASVLTGTVTAVGSQVSLTASIRETATGNELATASIRGSVDRMLELTDELAVSLLRDLWRSNAPLPTVQVASLTTSSPAALSAYLRGESFLRGMQPDSALYFFERATQIDSTFALAWMRMSSAAGWTGEENLVAQRMWAGRALALIDRLPEREASLVRGYNLYLNGSLAALDTFARYTERYPDDPQGHYQLGDARFHIGQIGVYTSDEIIEPFLAATRLDPTLGMGLVHVLDMTLDQGDSVGFKTALQRFERVAPAERSRSFRAQARVRWAPADSLLQRFSEEVRPLDPARERREVNYLIGALGNQVRLNPDVDPTDYISAMDTLLKLFSGDRYFRERARNLRGLHFSALGMADSAAADIDRWVALDPEGAPPLPAPELRSFIRVAVAFAGGLPPERVQDDIARLEAARAETPFLNGLLHVYYTGLGEHDKAARFSAPTDDIMPPQVVDTAAYLRAESGWIRVMRGDTIGGLRQFEEAITKVAGMPGGPWAEYGEVLTTMPSRREQGIRVLRWQAAHVAASPGQNFLLLGRALERSGDVAGAREAYQHVLRLWQYADPFKQAGRDEALAALTRLAGEQAR